MDQVVARPEGPAIATTSPATRRPTSPTHRGRVARRRSPAGRWATARRREPEGLPTDLLLALLA